MDKKALLKKVAAGLGALLLFIALSYAFVPEVLDGKIVNQGDISHYNGMAHEMAAWNKAHPDDPTYWTGAMFSGMPTAAVTVHAGGDLTRPLYDGLLLGFRPATYLFIALLGGFLLMLALGVDGLLALGGAVAIGFCSYNFQIIQAGHNTKMQAIAFMPWVLAALIWTYRTALKEGLRGRSWWARTVLAAALFGLTLSFEIKAGHVQITYYLALMIALYALMMLVWMLWRHRQQWRPFFIASGLLLLTGGIGIATNANQLLPLSDYTPYSIRGGSELKGDAGNGGQKAGTLDLEYATQWSYGWNELPNLFVPNWNGGGNGARTPVTDDELREVYKGYIVDSYTSMALDEDPSLREKEARELIQQYYGADIAREARSVSASELRQIRAMTEGYMYWGPQPFTAGPMYIGCITVFLFVLGLCCLYDRKESWWLLAVTLLAALLSVGYNSDGSHALDLQGIAFALLPMYGKFRTVSMILVLLQVTLPMLGFLALDGVLKQRVPVRRLRIALIVSLLVTGGFLLLSLAFGRSFVAAGETLAPGGFVAAMASLRQALLRSDIWVCLLLIALTAGLIYWVCLAPAKKGSFVERHRRILLPAGVGILVLVNLFSVGKRYLNESHFITPRDFDKVYDERPVDRDIRQRDPAKMARVLDLSGDTFNSAIASYHHRCIGGYSPAKLQRYQDLIQHYLSGEVALAKHYAGQYDWDKILSAMPITALLNGRHIITPDGSLVENPYAFGPAWFVRDAVLAESPDEEIALLEDTDLYEVAVVGADFAVPDAVLGATSEETEEDLAWVDLLSYAPNALQYRYECDSPRLLVFSEVYHPDWTATLDGVASLPLLRVDWLLRAAVVPAGTHEISMRFDPPVYARGRSISLASSLTLLLLLLLSAGATLVIPSGLRKG